MNVFFISADKITRLARNAHHWCWLISRQKGVVSRCTSMTVWRLFDFPRLPRPEAAIDCGQIDVVNGIGGRLRSPVVRLVRLWSAFSLAAVRELYCTVTHRWPSDCHQLDSHLCTPSEASTAAWPKMVTLISRPLHICVAVPGFLKVACSYVSM